MMNVVRKSHTAMFLLLASALCRAQAQDVTSGPVEPQALIQLSPTQTAQTSERQRLLGSYVEAGGNYLALSDNFGSWSGGYARGVFVTKKDVFSGEVNGQREFGDSGTYLSVGDSHTFNADWYASLTVGSSASGFFWPRYRTDGFLNRKWLARKQWITTFGAGYYAAKDPHRDHSFFVGSTYYFEKPWIVESGIRFNVSNPGSVFSPAGFVAVTQGRNKKRYLTARVGMGVEAYELIGPTSSLSNFQSQTLTMTWRQWMGKNWGLNFVGDYYHNPFYSRGGSSVGIFTDF